MRKLFLFLSFVFLLGFNLHNSTAQQYTIIGAFASVPLGDYGSKELPEGEFVNPGVGLVFESRNNPTRWPEGLGFRSHFSYQRNPMDSKAISRELTESFGGRTEVSESRHSPLIIRIGPSYDINFGKVVSLGFSPQFGVLFNSTDSFSIEVYDETESVIFSDIVNFNNNPALCYSMQADLEFTLVPDFLHISLYTGYTRSDQKIQTEIGGDLFDSNQLIEFLNTGIKVVLQGD